MPWECGGDLNTRQSRLGSWKCQWHSVCSMTPWFSFTLRFGITLENCRCHTAPWIGPMVCQGVGNLGPFWFMCPNKNHKPRHICTSFWVSSARLFFEWDGDDHCGSSILSCAGRWQLMLHCAGRTKNRTGPGSVRAGGRWCRFGRAWRSFVAFVLVLKRKCLRSPPWG
jgi:hypothetical protein